MATAGDGREALERLRQMERPCLILLDLMMPIMNGWDFMAEVKKSRQLEDLPVVVVSAYSQRKAEGVRRVLKKPLDVNQLLTAVADYCCCPPKPAVVQH